MADSSQLIAQALEKALSAPDGLPLLATKQAVGLFPSAAKDAVEEARAAGLVRVLRTEAKGKSTIEIGTLTEKGLLRLLETTSPRPVLEALLKAIDACQVRVDAWVAAVAENRKSLDGLRELATRVLTHLQNPEATLPTWARNGNSHDPATHIVDLVRAWHAAGKIGDYPLPDLFEHVRTSSPRLTLGQFHDALRTLHDSRKVALHPWTGPLHELPQPAHALLVGHEIAYYVNLLM